MIQKIAVLGSLVLLLVNAGFSQTYDTVRVATYNLLNYSMSDSTTRNPAFRKIMHAIDPDIVIVQEMISSAAQSCFLNNVMNAGQPGTYAAAPFSDGYDTDNALYYKSAKFSFVGPQTVLHTALRDINGYRLRPAGVGADSLDIQIYSAHLKASQGYESDRAAEAETLRTHLTALPDGGFFVTGGDFNLYTSTEPAFANFTGSRADNSGRLYDPISTSGTWHDGASFAGIHTQATRSSDGGMDDRFDFLLLGYAYQSPPGWEYVPGSYTAYGNDGNHLNQSINVLPNTAVPDSIANALFTASDHVPVFLDVRRALGEAASITVLSPNGGESWSAGSNHNITWSSGNLSGTVTLKLNRNYPGGAWETLFSGIANSGTQSWTVTLPASTAARIQAASDAQPSITDISDANFSLVSASLTLISPNGGESWVVGQPGTLSWSSSGISGNIRIELNRSYPAGNWEILYGSAVNDGSESWTVTGPATSHARIRIYGVNQTTVGDTSAADFTIHSFAPPVVMHDPHGDAAPGTVTFTAYVTDDLPGVSAKLFYGSAGTSVFDSVAMTPTGFANEFSASVSLAFGRWHYIIRATDNEGQAATTPVYTMVAAPQCGLSLAYDDSTAEVFNWAADSNMAWAVRFTPIRIPFALAGAEISIAGFHPDSSHSPIRVKVLAADGPNGMPGTLLREVRRGSIGNVVGGLPSPGGYVASVALSDDSLDPLIFNSDFYVAVLNSGEGIEAFGLDTSSAYMTRSVLFDACSGQWQPEDGTGSSARRGNRMVRVNGWQDQSPQLLIYSQGNDVHLTWPSTGASYYKIYRSLSADAASFQLVASTTDNWYVFVNEILNQGRVFYRVASSSNP
jgi:endonuclease/exonuclease/phosphatase family metal-dependent hydrolase